MLMSLAIVCAVVALIFRLGNESIRFHLYYVLMIVLSNTITLLLLPFAILFPNNHRLMRIANLVISTLVSEALDVKWNLRCQGDLSDLTLNGVVVANHQSVIDLLGIHCVYNRIVRAGIVPDWKVSIMATRELMYFPYGIFYWLTGRLIVFDRDNSKSRENVQREAAKKLQNKRTLFIFPEGRRNKSDERLMPFKKGAFRLAIENQVPIVPVVNSPFVFVDRRNKTMKRGEITVSVLKPIPTVGLELKDLDELTSKVYKIMNHECHKLRKEVSLFNDWHNKMSMR